MIVRPVPRERCLHFYALQEANHFINLRISVLGFPHRKCTDLPIRIKLCIPLNQRFQKQFRFLSICVTDFLKDFVRHLKETLNKSAAAERRAFCPIRAVPKLGNTQSIPTILVLSAEPKSLAVSSCRFNQSFPKCRTLSYPEG